MGSSVGGQSNSMNAGGTNMSSAGGKGGGTPQQVTTQPVGDAVSINPQGNAQPNMFNMASNATQAGMAGAYNEMGYQPMMVQAGSYNPMMVQGGSYNPYMINLNQLSGYAGGSGGGARADMIDPNQANMTAAQTSAEGIQKFMDPYTSQVIDTSLADIERSRQQQQNAAAAQAQAAGAFGGSRGALMESEVGRNALDQAARTSSQLRSQGYSQALNAAQQETGLRQQANAQNAQQQLQALLANQASGLAASQTNAQVGAQRQASRLNAMLGAMQSNQAAANRAPEFSLAQRLDAALANQGASQSASQFNLGQQLNAALANQGAQLAGSSQRLAAGNQLANIGNLGFGQAQQVLGGMQQAGNMQQLLQQQILDAAKGQYGGYTGFPSQALGYYAQALGATQMPQSTTTSRQPGLFDYLTLGMMM